MTFLAEIFVWHKECTTVESAIEFIESCVKDPDLVENGTINGIPIYDFLEGEEVINVFA